MHGRKENLLQFTGRRQPCPLFGRHVPWNVAGLGGAPGSGLQLRRRSSKRRALPLGLRDPVQEFPHPRLLVGDRPNGGGERLGINSHQPRSAPTAEWGDPPGSFRR